MADIKAFKCMKPTKELADKVAALPYDVYNRKEALEAVKGNEYSFLRIDRAETSFGDDVDTYDDRVYAKAKELLDKMEKDGVYVNSDEECYYIYELTMDNRVQTGIVACASIDDYLNNVIKKHENTRAEKEVDRIRHVDTCSAQTGPIFLAYRENDVIKNIIDKNKKNEPIFSFIADDGIKHVGYVINDKDDIEKIENEFKGINDIYIADGHHRAASAVKVGLKRREENKGYDGSEEFNYFLSVLFQEQELKILPYNRVVRDLNGLSKEEFLDKIKECFDITVLEGEKEPENKTEFTMYLDGTWYLLKAKKEIISDDEVKGLDVSILQDNLLDSVLGIKDPRTDDRIDFIGGIRGLKELVKRCNEDMEVAFAMYPTSIEELFNVADAKKLMPPKSTWFEPKLRSGLFIHKI
ncbi:Uncharacterized conserved protein, DUF1015 family [Lachnospiraceae bacterium RM5]|nr:Uncharacterized conserved protein, DUF1015 family [Lachnospiraceae bacterium RM5]